MDYINQSIIRFYLFMMGSVGELIAFGLHRNQHYDVIFIKLYII